MLERISRLIKSRKLSSSQFADEIGVQRSSVSHVLSGRNKPSLDFVTKILMAYEDLNSEWLLTGKGSMFRDDFESTESGVLPFEDHDSAESDIAKGSEKEELKPQALKIGDKKTAGSKRIASGDSVLERIVLFYKDGTFREFTPEQD